MREKTIEESYCDYAEERGWLVRKMTYAGRRGCPDRWFFKGGKAVIVEFKARGKRPDDVQEREHKRLHDRGFPVHVIDTYTAYRAAELFGA